MAKVFVRVTMQYIMIDENKNEVKESEEAVFYFPYGDPSTSRTTVEDLILNTGQLKWKKMLKVIE